ncbi:MAG: LysM peptidoglycan-binding domain-containing protein [Thermoanaerobaculales bacterium]|jgi:nucleoid-associated protein YgaU|nr:LysM peptidoglycan-binding domain-containing protein [Thermoanaerobaculales bacterium]
MGLFGKSFNEKVTEAVAEIKKMNLGVRNLSADVAGEVVTLRGEAASRQIATRVMEEMDQRVKPDNIVNAIKIDKPAPAPAPAAAPVVTEADEESPTERYHMVVKGETLSHISAKYYGKANQYMKIFEANRDILDNPDLIKPGQKLRIP